MIGSLIQSFLWFSESFFLTILILIFGHTWNLHFKGWGSIIKHNKSVFYAFWHENMLPVLFSHRGRGVGIIVAISYEGELVARVLKILGYRVFRGDTQKRGRTVTKELIKYGLSGKEIAITPDGPKGPRREVKKGVIIIAKRANIPLFAVKIEADRCFRFSSWDRLMLPLPFSKIKISIKGPIKKLDGKILKEALSN